VTYTSSARPTSHSPVSLCRAFEVARPVGFRLRNRHFVDLPLPLPGVLCKPPCRKSPTLKGSVVSAWKEKALACALRKKATLFRDANRAVVGRIWRSEATRLEDPLGISNGMWALKSSGERNGVPSLVRFDVVCPLNGIMGTSTYNIWHLHCVAGTLGLYR
jgi:hypothetical protein